ncbi:acyl-CoA carboxylase subunit epsilon [Williamsia deligens]|uniref:Acyl-CoA carboxylase subunit epsilon n=1 Tax=Williamsia deligens TaxID=321325 RepID=A0ABW3GB33_9NOCA|nr:acyl-CoA carboxylase subunit epsilon [Williamsia deligens]MCP2196194.1 Acyl-CoA carboxylase epsilon subunit [Williamsia deligens]
MSDDTTAETGEATPADGDPGEGATVRPAFSIIRGNPDDVDIAVLTAVLSAAGSAPSHGGGEQRRDLWGSPEQRLRPSWSPAPTAFLNVHFSH